MLKEILADDTTDCQSMFMIFYVGFPKSKTCELIHAFPLVCFLFVYFFLKFCELFTQVFWHFDIFSLCFFFFNKFCVCFCLKSRFSAYVIYENNTRQKPSIVAAAVVIIFFIIVILNKQQNTESKYKNEYLRYLYNTRDKNVRTDIVV